MSRPSRLHAGLARLQSRERGGAGGALLRAFLQLLAHCYRGGRGLHRGLYRRGLRRRVRLPRPVLSVGNLTAGGVGKTPLIAWLAEALLAAHQVPVVLARGYGKPRASSLNDEGRWLTSRVPGLCVLQSRDRAAACREFLERGSRADLFLLDDGFQHERLARDLDWVLVDATCPFGHGYFLPRGLLRDAPRALARASLILLTRVDSVAPEKLSRLRLEVAALAPGVALAEAAFPVTWVLDGGVRRSASCLEGLVVVLASGVGNPAAVRRTVERLGAVVVEECRYPDHHSFTRSDAAWIAGRCREHAARLVMTSKDAVRLSDPLRAELPALVVLLQEVEIVVGREHLEQQLHRLTGAEVPLQPWRDSTRCTA